MADYNATMVDENGNNLYPTTQVGNVLGLSDSINAISNAKADKDLSNVTYPTNTAGSTTTGSGDRVIETYISSDSKSWYRKWASGWKECGGYYDNGSNVQDKVFTITLPLTFSNTYYSLSVNAARIDNTQSYRTVTNNIYYKSTSQFKAGWFRTDSGLARISTWYACGY